MSISKILRKQVAKRASFRCEYCQLSEISSYLSFEVEHIIAKKHGGGDEILNLAYACPQCNQYKGTDLTTFIGDYQNIVPLFNPRLQVWSENFEIQNGVILPKTEIGEATVKLLKLNTPERVELRKLLG